MSLRRTAVYPDVHEDSSTGSTTKIPDRGLLRNRSSTTAALLCIISSRTIGGPIVDEVVERY
ncbi:hypothetical protein FACS189472_00070 [Alphaproteobacteria bacterium]|nr:hypothetical protein FACS189472_00070 [Alphaproteobacteria bacterium]